MKGCIACRVDAEARKASTSFLAGISFAFTFTPKAMREQLCEEHAKSLTFAHVKALEAVKPEDRR